MAKYSLTTQIAEIERELKMREKVYPRMKYGPGHTFARPSESAMATEIMKAVLETLQWLHANRTRVLDEVKKEASPQPTEKV